MTENTNTDTKNENKAVNNEKDSTEKAETNNSKKNKPVYVVNGNLVESLPISTRISRAVDGIVQFCGLYVSTLLSVDPRETAINSRFAQRSVRGPSVTFSLGSGGLPSSSTQNNSRRGDSNNRRPGGGGSGGNGGSDNRNPRFRTLADLHADEYNNSSKIEGGISSCASAP